MRAPERTWARDLQSGSCVGSAVSNGIGATDGAGGGSLPVVPTIPRHELDARGTPSFEYTRLRYVCTVAMVQPRLLSDLARRRAGNEPCDDFLLPPGERRLLIRA